jgi:hypothetical protein
MRVVNAFYNPYSERKCAEDFVTEGVHVLSHYTDSSEPMAVITKAGGYGLSL